MDPHRVDGVTAGVQHWYCVEVALRGTPADRTVTGERLTHFDQHDHDCDHDTDADR